MRASLTCWVAARRLNLGPRDAQGGTLKQWLMHDNISRRFRVPEVIRLLVIAGAAILVDTIALVDSASLQHLVESCSLLSLLDRL